MSSVQQQHRCTRAAETGNRWTHIYT